MSIVAEVGLVEAKGFESENAIYALDTARGSMMVP